MARIRKVFLALFAFAVPAPAATHEGRVVAVATGHTLVVLAGSSRVTVRLAGVTAPVGSERHAIASRQSLIALCGGEPARLETAVPMRPETEVVASVQCNGADAAAEQVRRGMARVSPGDERAAAALHVLEAQARAARRGVWSRSPLR